MKKKRSKKLHPIYDKVSATGRPYYFPMWDKNNKKTYRKNIDALYTTDSGKFNVWKPFWVDNIDRLENLYYKLNVKTIESHKKACETFASLKPLYIENPKKEMNFYYPISNDKVNVVSLKVANIDEMYWSYSEDIEKKRNLFQSFFNSPEWTHQNPKIFKIWKKYKKEINYYCSRRTRANLVKDALIYCLTELLNKKYKGCALDTLVFHLDINGRRYHVEYDAFRTEPYRLGKIVSFINLNNLITVSSGELYV
jgi:hypothetical protein